MTERDYPAVHVTGSKPEISPATELHYLCPEVKFGIEEGVPVLLLNDRF